MMTDAAPLTYSHDGVISLQSEKCGSTISSFNSEKLLPEDVPQFVQQAAAQMSSRSDSDNRTSSIFEPAEEAHRELTEPTQATDSPGEEPGYDLKPPPPSLSHTNAETLSERLFSVEHLNVILLDHAFNAKFTNFLNRYRPNMCPVLSRYQAIQKAKAAIDYANIIAESMPAIGPHSSANTPAAILHKKFDLRSRHAVDELISDALPLYITHQLVSMVTECLVKEITGNNVPIMRELVQGLAEVYCLSDSSLPDNPIVYASEEFYKTTQYGRNYVIGRNCRFLQGPKSARPSVNRLVEALSSGIEACETILNYRRDGSPFLNLLMIAPLYDNKGRVRYFIGCQIDVTNLIEDGRGLGSFEQLLEHDRSESRFREKPRINSTNALGALGRLLNKEEMDEIKQQAEEHDVSNKTAPSRPSTARRRLGMDEPPEKSLWAPAHYGPSGRLPGVYQNYLLVRPYPSLRITFTSPALRIPQLVQSKFMDRIGGPQHIREGILESLRQGVGVTAKISWLTQSNAPGDGVEGKPRWIHCTPLFGSDDKVGVWMIVMIEKEEITGSLNAHQVANPISTTSVPLGRVWKANSSLTDRYGSLSERYESAKLYSQWLREGRARHSSSVVGQRGRVDSVRNSSSFGRPPRDTEDRVLEL